ncbi:MAG: M56 family metallopeptidase [Bacteroidetes bacterium]|nr:M56 family metallopeptidase [Bacteroidota bacterium]
MNVLERFLTEEIMYALGWTVVHSFWQAMLIALIMAVAMVALQKKSAQLRYVLANASLLLVFLLAIFTFFSLYYSGGDKTMQEITLVAANTAIENKDAAQISFSTFFQSGIDYFNTHLPLIVAVWFLGLAFFSLRMLGGLAYVQHLKRQRNAPLSDFWQKKLTFLAKKIQVKKSVQLLESALVKVPMVVGYLKPVILLPVGAVNQLSTEQVEVILAHELAHIHRKDYLLNIIQSFIETLLYFNPAVWWISATIRTERENCCDDTAIAICGNSLAYAKALVNLQEMNHSVPVFAMTFSGQRHQLLNRIQRILKQPHNKFNIMEKLTATCMLLLAIAAFSISARNPVEENFTPTDYELLENAELEIVKEFTEVKKYAEKNDLTVKIVQRKEIQSDENVELYQDIEIVIVDTDTLPPPPPKRYPLKGSAKLEFKKDGKKVKATMKDGKLTHLKIDGKSIPKEELSQYEGYVSDLLHDVGGLPPAPPVPPTPPVSPVPPTPAIAPTPPTPPTAAVAPVPPVPPAPTAPKIWKKDEVKVMKKEKDKDGNSLIIIESDDSELVEIKVEKGGDVFIVNGENLEDGKMIVIEPEKGNSFYLFNHDKEPFLFDGNTFHIETDDFVFSDKGNLEELMEHDQWDVKKWNDWVEEHNGGVLKLNYEFKDKYKESAKNYQKQLKDFKGKRWEYDNELFQNSFDLYRNEIHYDEDLQRAFEGKMLEKDLIEDNAVYKLEITSDQLKVNGKKQPVSTLEDFKRIYEEKTGKKLTSKSKVVIEKSEEE